jgi:hypothetical protein
MTREKRTAALKEELHAFLRKGRMEKVRRYLQEGQHFESLSDTNLRSEWISAFKRYSVSSTDSRSRKLFDDLQAEMEIRLIDPPFGEVVKEAEMLIELQTKPHEAQKLTRHG